ncbi:uncharacterized protein B0H18DRAFT_1120068 [Fomitopsis serialis]|uniref:uncharacterized protein n=1 Tax=Fomitopsis serialis TaxID=139415 RepID=UPI0020075CF5|nr:uncharacterized protein B0H18DRAFT_1120068 [Neoantrodia serialis]KAH9924215.1 hypothetical protein B0H18DRAFT_1120068 [Neoantrodia serialis]
MLSPGDKFRPSSDTNIVNAVSASGGYISAVSDQCPICAATHAGTLLPCNLRVPIPWAALNGLEDVTHSHNHFDLACMLPPHPTFQRIPLFNDDAENPYEFELGDCHGDVASFEKRLANIANVDGSCIAKGSEWEDRVG